ncbi:MAG: OPT/YSL family transporter [Myxococcota bacterium]
MAIPQLDREQIATWTREQKDRWWLANVYRGAMPQLTLRSAAAGFVLGGVLASTNLYVGAKTGWSLGVGVTSVILAYVLFRVLGMVGGRPFTLLENNAVQSVATAAGYMTAPLISSLSAYMVVTNHLLPRYQVFLWMAANSVLGVLIAFPLKRRFVNDEQQPFPEGRACAVVLDALYPDAPPGGAGAVAQVRSDDVVKAGHDRAQLQARALFAAGAVSAFLQFWRSEGYQVLLQQRLLGLSKVVIQLPERILDGYYRLAEQNGWPVPKILGTDLRELAITPTLDLTMFGAGGLIGMRTAWSLLLGCFVNWFVLAPVLIRVGEIAPSASGHFGRGHILNSWSLWWGVAIMVTGSLTSLFAKPELLLSSFRGWFDRRGDRPDPLAQIELPLWVSWIGVPVMSGVVITLNTWWFDIDPWLLLASIPLLVLLTLIAANSTALTGTTPTGSLSKISQFTFGALDPTRPATNLMTGGITSEVASNAANLLMDIKPGYMLGASPRQQAVGHVIGIVSGGIAATTLFYPLFLPHPDLTKPLRDQLMTDEFPMPSVELWRGVSELIASGGSDLRDSALWAMAIAAVIGVGIEWLRVRSGGRFPLSPVSIGLGVVIPVDSTLMMFAGALFFAGMRRRYEGGPPSAGRTLWVESYEPVAAGLVAGAALTGIGDQLITVFVLGS